MNIDISDEKIYYFIDNVHSGKVIECKKQDDNTTKCKSMKGKNYYIDNSKGKESLSLIKCSNNNCKLVTGIGRMSYLHNNGEKIITCSNKYCYYNDDANKEKYFINYDNEKAKTYQIIKYDKDENVWENISINNNDIFINGNNEDNLVNSIIYCYNESSCEERNSYNNAKYININRKKTIECKDDNCDEYDITQENAYLINKYLEVINSNEKNSELVVFKKNSHGIIEYASPSLKYYINGNGESIIQNKNNEISIIQKNSLEKGYYINNSENIIVFNGNQCEIYNNNNNNISSCKGNRGLLINGNKVCIGYDNQNSKDIYASTNGIYIITVDRNKFPGINGVSYILIEINSDKITIKNSSSTVYYLVDNTNGKIISNKEIEGELYKCGSSGICENITDKTGTYPNDDLTTYEKYQKIVCKNNKCVGKAKGINDIYCLKGTELYTCDNKSCDNISEENCYREIHKSGNYLSETDDPKIINCTVDKCEYMEDVKKGNYDSEDKSQPLIRCEKPVDKMICVYDKPRNGYFISGGGEFLIKCSKFICTAYKQNNKKLKRRDSEENEIKIKNWYISGENDGLIYCDYDKDESEKCVSYDNPQDGWYIRGNDYDDYNSMYLLIYCKNNNCVEKDSINEGYYINSGYVYDYVNSVYLYDDKPFIKCDNISCVSVDVCPMNYYVNAEDDKIIYCNENKNCNKLNSVNNGWYISKIGDDCDSTSTLIKCNEESCVLKQFDMLNKGYYLNSDSNTNMYYPLIIKNVEKKKFENASDVVNGYYINSDNEANKMEKIIQCTNSTSCNYMTKEINTVKCNESINGEFTIENSIIKWCNNNESVFSKSEEYTKIIEFSKNNFIPGVVKPKDKDTSYVLLSINENYLVQYKSDGYILQNGLLYFCDINNEGLCEHIENEEINNGYYINHKEKTIIECNKNLNIICKYKTLSKDYIDCSEDQCSDYKNDNKSINCKNDNIFIDENSNIQLCLSDDSKNSNSLKLEEVTNEKLYSLKSKSFLDLVESRYMIVKVSKYSIIYIDNIEEIENCENATEALDKNQVCLYNDNKSIKLKYVESSSDLSSGIHEINSYNVLKKISSNYDTNNGYYIYKCEYSLECQLITAYVLIDSIKYKCDINDLCLEKEISKFEAVGYQITESGLLAIINKENSKEIVETRIRNGIYIKNDGDIENIILCESNGRCQEKENTFGIKKIGNNIKVNNNISDELKTKYIYDKIEGADDYDVYELTSVSLIPIDDTRNIFTDADNYIITNEKTDIVNGYMCIEGNCSIIPKNGNDRYYLNTVQNGSIQNAIVKCGSSNKCLFENNTENNIFENAATFNKDNIVLKCSSEMCKEASITKDYYNGLPNCTKRKDKENEILPLLNNNNCVRDDYSTPLLLGQHCILDGIIYKYDGNSCTAIEKEKIYVFDNTLREIADVTDIRESHKAAYMYNCLKNNKCFKTYGYIVGENNYLTCDSLGCEIYNNEKTLDNNCENTSPGNLIHIENENVASLCINEKDHINIFNNNNKYYYINNINNHFPESENEENILVVTNNNIVSVVLIDDYLLLDKNNNLSKGENLGDILYQCEQKNCKSISEPDYGYYYSSYVEKVIEYSKTGYKYINEKTKKFTISNTELQFSDNTKYYYLENSNISGYSMNVIMEATKNKISILKIDNYIALNTSENELQVNDYNLMKNNMYLCNSYSGKCSIQNMKKDSYWVDGWFISGDKNNKVIKCVESNCIMYNDLRSTCQFEGDIIFKNNMYYFCYYDRSKLTELQITGSLGNIGKIINISENNKLSNKVKYVIVNYNSVVSLWKNNVDLNIKNPSLPTCSNINCITTDGTKLSENEYCIKDSTIYQYKEDKCITPFEEGKLVKLFRKDMLIDASNIDLIGEGTMMYYCDNGKCRLTTGYIKIDQKYYSCEPTGCYETVQGKNIGQIDNGSLNINDGKKGVLGTNTNYYYYINGYNEFPGAESNSSILIESGLNYFIIFKGNGYYLIGNNDEMINYINDADTPYETIGHLYLCENQLNGCSKQNNGVTGYFVNSGDNNKSIIQCKNDVCQLVQNIQNKCSFVGAVLRKNKNINFEICLSNLSSHSILLNQNSNNSKIYLLDIGEGDNFSGISITNNENYKNSTVQIMVEATSKYVKLYNIEGYLLYNKSSNEIVETTGYSGKLYRCEMTNINIYTDDSFNICNIVSTINDGWYFNFNSFSTIDNKLYIQCSNKSCTMEKSNKNECTESGSLIYGNDERFMICTSNSLYHLIDIESLNNNNYIMLNVSNLDVFPGVNTNNTDIITCMNRDSVYKIDLNTHVLVKENSLIVDIENNATNNEELLISPSKLLYDCNSVSGCIRKQIITNNSWFIKKSLSYGDSLINCNNGECIQKIEINEGFYINDNKKLPLIQCILPGYINENNEFIKTNNITCQEKNYKNGWFLDGNKNTIERNKLINCSKENGCRELDIDNGWYINEAYFDNSYAYGEISNQTIYPIIECRNDGCKYYEKKLNQKCSSSGEIIASSGFSKALKICIDDNISVDFSSDSNDFTYEIINKNEVFPETIYSNILTKIGTNEISSVKTDGYYYIIDSIYKCVQSECEKVVDSGITVYEELKQNIATYVCYSNDKCNWEFNKSEGLMFIDYDSKLVTDINNLNINEVYKCKKNNNDINCVKLPLNEGIYINNNIEYKENDEYYNDSVYYSYDGYQWIVRNEDNIKKCSYLQYKNNYCYIDTKEDDDVVQPGDICITYNGRYYLALDEINSGVDKANCVALPLSSNKNTYYYNINDEAYIVDRYSAYKTDNDDVNLYVSLNNNDSLNSTEEIWIEKGEVNEDYLVVCSHGKCERSKAIYCSYDFQLEKCKLKSNINTGSVCISEKDKTTYLVKENIKKGYQGSCIIYGSLSHNQSLLYNNENVVSLEPDNSYYYLIDGKMVNIKDNIINNTMKEGIYLIDNLNRNVVIDESKEVDISEDSDLKLYICDYENGCNLKKEEINNTEYPIEYFFDSNTNKLLQYNSNTKAVRYMNKKGYYLNSLTNTLVKCYSDGTCKLYNSENGMEGYYLDSGYDNDEYIIKCLRENEVFECKYENIVICTLNVDDNTCSSDVDLINNGYCFSIIETVNGIEKYLIYIKEFIKAGDERSCIVSSEIEDYFYSYKETKFLGKDKNNLLLKITSSSITSIYENTVGYYVISTVNKSGILEDTAFSMSKFYECEKDNCIDILLPNENKIYINNASSEKMIHYDPENRKWKLIKNRYTYDKINEGVCRLSKYIYKNDIIYNIKNDEVTFYVTDVNIDPKLMISSLYITPIKNDTFHYIGSKNEMYYYNESLHSFNKINENGYYIFKYDDQKLINLEPYKTTVTSIMDDSPLYYVFIYENGWNSRNPYYINYFSGKMGYYWNKADINENGLILQSMVETTIDQYGKMITTNKTKNIINKCIGKKKNICNNIEKGQMIGMGSSCVIYEEQYRGLYLATSAINNNSTTTNCIKYDDKPTYKFYKTSITFAEQNIENAIIIVNSNDITQFTGDFIDEDYLTDDKDYYVFESLSVELNSTVTIDTVYKCGISIKLNDTNNIFNEYKNYECQTLEKNGNKYYYSELGGVIHNTGNKWFIENNKGYYFFNEKNLSATVNTIDDENIPDENIYIRYGNADNYGLYINSAEIEKTIFIRNTKGKGYKIDLNVPECKHMINSNNTCVVNDDQTIQTGDICYDKSSKSLYILETTDSSDKLMSIAKCYSGNFEETKYHLIGDRLYKLDGASVQEMNQGYFILNEKMESFDSDFPETPYKIVDCYEGNCQIIENYQDIKDYIIINQAGNENNHLLRNYMRISQYSNVKKPGFYLFNENDSENQSNNSKYTKIYEIADDGSLYKLVERDGEYYRENIDDSIELDKSEFNPNNIYVNYATENTLTLNLKPFFTNKVFYNDEKDEIESNHDDINSTHKIESKYEIINNKIYKYSKNSLIEMASGIYLLKNGYPFNSKEWMTLNGNNDEICYYDGNGCTYYLIDELKDKKYIINDASPTLSLVEYDGKADKFRVIDEDGYYFLSENKYSISVTENIIGQVVQIINGHAYDITKDNANDGYFIFNSLKIESKNSTWEDAELAEYNIEVINKDKEGNIMNDINIKFNEVNKVNSNQCISYNKNESIEPMNYCYDGSNICLPKETIDSSQNNTIGNCLFKNSNDNNRNNNNNGKYYYSINDNLYAMNNKYYHRIGKPGVHVINNKSYTVYDSTVKYSANAYLCESNNKCTLIKEWESGYYLNIANDDIDNPIILYHDNVSNTWVNGNLKDGYYFFNSKGEYVGVNEEITYAFYVNNNGQSIENLSNNADIGKYIDSANIHQHLVVEYYGAWNTTEEIIDCKINSQENENVSFTSKSELYVENLCIDSENQTIVFVTKKISTNLFDIEYEGIIIPTNKTKYAFIEDNKNIVKISNNKLTRHQDSGYIVYDKTKSRAFDSFSIEIGNAYKCRKGSCEEFDIQSINTGVHIVNMLSDTYLVLTYMGEGQWIVENKDGYYFFNVLGNSIENDEYVDKAYRVYSDENKIIHEDITKSTNIGYYTTKNFGEKLDEDIFVLFFNEYKFWSKSEIPHSCNVTLIDNNQHLALCQTFNKNITYEAGNYCYDSNQKQIYLLINNATVDTNETNCIYGTNTNPFYAIYNSRNKGYDDIVNIETLMLNGISINENLVELTNNNIKEIKNGYFILNTDGSLADFESELLYNNTLIVYCDGKECYNEFMNSESIIMDHKGDIITYNESDDVFEKMNEPGYYFFSQGNLWHTDNEPLDTIVHIFDSSNGTLIKETLNLDDLSIGAYINAGDLKSICEYDGVKWLNIQRPCSYYNDTCNYYYNSKLDDYVIHEGKFSVISGVDEKNRMMTLIDSDDNYPTYLYNEPNNKLAVMETNSITYINDEGYYLINSKTNKAILSDDDDKNDSLLIWCESNGNCVSVQPEKGYSYLNKSPLDPDNYNIVYYLSDSIDDYLVAKDYCNITSLDSTTSNGRKEYTCQLLDGGNSSGTICIDVDSKQPFLLQDQNQCIEMNENEEIYLPINKSLLMINSTNTKESSNGYFFINKFNYEISDRDSYSHWDTEGFICNYLGKCKLLKPKGVLYFIDYNTLKYPYFNVVKFDENNRIKNESSGYEIATKEGLYKLEDGYYAKCFFNDHDEIACKHPDEVTTSFDVEGKLTLCTESDDNEVSCKEATQGGYYLLDNEIIDCEVDENHDKLECQKNQKEGYFVTVNENNSLYSCNCQNKNKNNSVNSNKSRENTMVDDKDDNQNSTSNPSPDDLDSTKTVEYPSSTEMDLSSTETNLSSNEVTCSLINFGSTNNITIESQDEMIELYHSDQDENTWNSSCSSKNYIKYDNFFECEDFRISLDVKKINYVNANHTFIDDDDFMNETQSVDLESTTHIKSTTVMDTELNSSTSLSSSPTFTNTQYTSTTYTITSTTPSNSMITSTTTQSKSITSTTSTDAPNHTTTDGQRETPSENYVDDNNLNSDSSNINKNSKSLTVVTILFFIIFTILIIIIILLLRRIKKLKEERE